MIVASPALLLAADSSGTTVKAPSIEYGALSPVLYGMVSDLLSVPVMMVLIAGVVLTTLPLVWGLRPALRKIGAR